MDFNLNQNGDPCWFIFSRKAIPMYKTFLINDLLCAMKMDYETSNLMML